MLYSSIYRHIFYIGGLDMNRIDRLNAILIQLQSKRIVKAGEIAERFGISLRTVYRDIRALEEGGIPIGSEAGLGYFLMEGYRLPPLMISEEEASAMLIGGKLLESFADESMRKHYGSVLYKIRAILRTVDKDYVEDLDAQIKVIRRSAPPQDTTENLSMLQRALGKRAVIKVKYYSPHKNETSTRKLEPIGILFYSGTWHLVAWCQLREGYRDFRTDRFLKIELLPESYKANSHHDLETYLGEIRRRDKLQRIVLRIDKKIYSYLANEKYYLGFVGDKELENHFEVEFMNSDPEYFARSLLMFTDRAEIVEPPEMKARVKALIRKLSQHYSA